MKSGDVFSPSGLTINAGDTVRVTNNDAVNHNWTENDIGLHSGDLPPLASFSFTFKNPGRYAYECTIHQPQMNGTITAR